mgnify:FL=1
MTAILKPTHPSAMCQKCGAHVVVWRRPGLRAGLLRALALADHLKTLHPEAYRSAMGTFVPRLTR